MRQFRVGTKEEIKEIKMIRPGTDLKTWYNKQTNKPDILFNASLYTSSSPCGTIYYNGTMVHNDGVGFGFGTYGDTKTWHFGKPWDKKYYDYLTGYHGMIQGGKVIPNPPYSTETSAAKYVFYTSQNRIAFGEKDGCLYVITENTMPVANFAKECAEFDNVINLDGGGSRFLIYKGQLIYTSSRTPWNAIAIWLNKEEEKGIECNMKVKCKAKTAVMDSQGNTEAGRYISAGDTCEILSITPNVLVQIEYPVSNGKRVAFIKNLTNFTQP